jgi:hypothetical protein
MQENKKRCKNCYAAEEGWLAAMAMAPVTRINLL